MPSESRIPIGREMDIVTARQRGRELAAAIGFSGLEQTLLATAISEVVRNIVLYAETGEVLLFIVEERGRRGVRVVAKDQGPGIADPAAAMLDGYSTANSLGLGLPGARRLVDDFLLETAPGQGTTVTMTKWGKAGVP